MATAPARRLTEVAELLARSRNFGLSDYDLAKIVEEMVTAPARRLREVAEILARPTQFGLAGYDYTKIAQEMATAPARRLTEVAELLAREKDIAAGTSGSKDAAGAEGVAETGQMVEGRTNVREAAKGDKGTASHIERKDASGEEPKDET